MLYLIELKRNGVKNVMEKNGACKRYDRKKVWNALRYRNTNDYIVVGNSLK